MKAEKTINTLVLCDTFFLPFTHGGEDLDRPIPTRVCFYRRTDIVRKHEWTQTGTFTQKRYTPFIKHYIIYTRTRARRTLTSRVVTNEKHTCALNTYTCITCEQELHTRTDKTYGAQQKHIHIVHENVLRSFVIQYVTTMRASLFFRFARFDRGIGIE